ncbi:MAG: gliding motility-associated C-terminal domain-containing protein [Bacteroidetes bacterium]|nr:gliding motility-associated C-terminal domain-containing protein [Bacteroidota bacterium]
MKTKVNFLSFAFCILYFFLFPPWGGERGAAQGTWSPIAGFIDSLENGVAVAIGDKGYAGLGDNTTGSAQTYWWEYDPVANSWSQKADFPGAARIKANAFCIGNYAYVGIGASGGLFGYNDFYRYDPSSNSWSSIASFPGPQRYTTVSFVIQGKGYLGTGAAGTPFETYYKDFYQYDPSTNSWTQKTPYGGVKRRHAMGFAIGCKGYLGCGWDMSAFAWYQDFWEYDPTTNAWTQKASFPQTTEGGVGFSIGNKGYIGLGESSSGQHDEFWEYNPVNNSWTAIPDYPGGPRNRSFAFVIDSIAYVGTGNGPDTIYSNCYRYIPDNYDTNLVCCILLVTEAKTNETCGNADGSAILTETGGTPPLTYQWSNGATASNNTGLTAGNYFYTVTDASGCLFSDSVRISNTGVNVTATSVNATDSLTCDGEGTAIPSGGTPPYTYQWDPAAGNQTTATATGLCEGTYSVTVTDNNGCSATVTVTITWPKCFTIASSVTNVSCNGGNNGAIDITVGSGNPPYTYQWSNGATTEDISGLTDGTYTVTVTSSSAGSSTVFWSDDFFSSGAGWTLNTNGPGTNGNIPNYWIVNSISGCACGNGNYLHVTCDASGLGCTSGDCLYNDTPPFPPFFPDDPTSDKIAVSPTIPTSGYTGITLSFQWVADGAAANDYCKLRLSDDGGSTWNELSTEYSGTTICGQASIALPSNYENQPDFKFAFRWVNQANGNGSDPPFGVDDIELSVSAAAPACTLSQSFTVTEPNPFIVNPSKTDVTCPGSNDGSITINVSGGTTPYTFNWSNSQTINPVSGLASGTYTVTITDSKGCSTISTTTLTEAGSLVINTSVTSATCGNNDGSANANVSGGTQPFTYLWSNSQTGSTASSLTAGFYTVTVTDSKGCSGTSTATVNSSGGPSTAIAESSPACFGGNNGTATAAVSGGTPPYSYNWSSGQTASNATGLSSGTYYLTVTDAVLCQSFDTAVITDPAAISVTLSVIDATCGSNDGSVTASATGGTGTLTYLWSNSQTGSSITGLGAGNYYITVTDAKGCTETDSTSVAGIGGASLSLNSSGDVSCNGGSDGFININVSSGSPPYTFAWSNGASIEDISGIPDGIYIVSVTDNAGCLALDTFTITEPSAIATTTGKTDASCGVPDGSAWASASGGAPGYSFLWSNSATTSNITGIPAGNYFVTITDSKGCTKTDTVAVNETGAATLGINTVTDVSCSGGNDGSINIDVSGGTPPLTFSWSNGGTTEDIAGLDADNYAVTVTDNSGCKSYINATVTEPLQVTSTASATSANCTTGGTASIIASGGTAPYSYLWSNGDTTVGSGQLAVGNYTVTVTDLKGCTAVDTATVNQTGSITASITGINEICAGNSVMLVASGGVNYLWSNSVTNDTLSITPAVTDTYSVIVTQGACSDTAWYTVVVNPGVQVDAGKDTTIYIGESAGLNTTVNGGTPPFTYTWSTGSVTESINVSPVTGTEYFITVADGKGCTSKDSVFVDVLPCDAEVFVPNAFAPGCKCPDEQFRVYSDCIETVELRIFDRWGEMVYEYKGSPLPSGGAGGGLGWDGIFNGKAMDAAVYVFYLEYTTINNPDKEILLEGNVNLVR